jgi:hypothetical protein
MAKPGGKKRIPQEGNYILNIIPELINSIMEWNHLVRKELPENACWFATLSPDTCW